MSEHVDTLDREMVSSSVVDDAVAVIDDALGRMMSRDLIASVEVTDLLLDLRTLLTTHS